MRVNRHKCMYCGACVGVCPFNVIFLDETRVIIGEGCTACGLCVRACPVGAVDEE